MNALDKVAELDALLHEALKKRNRRKRIDIEKWHHYYNWLKDMGLKETASIIWEQSWT